MHMDVNPNWTITAFSNALSSQNCAPGGRPAGWACAQVEIDLVERLNEPAGAEKSTGWAESIPGEIQSLKFQIKLKP